jgi:hypothetical protein
LQKLIDLEITPIVYKLCPYPTSSGMVYLLQKNHFRKCPLSMLSILVYAL